MENPPDVVDANTEGLLSHCREVAKAKRFEFDPGVMISAVKHLQDLVRIRSVTGFEGAILHHIKETLEVLGLSERFEIQVHDPNVILEYTGDPDNPKYTTFVSHVDTVDFDAAEWSHAPDSGDIVESDGEWKLFGRGSLDVKQGTAASLALIEQLQAKPVDKNFRFVFYEGEETGQPTGASDLADAGVLTPNNTDVAFVIEPSGPHIIHGAFCNLKVEVVIDGISGHSSKPEHAINSILVLSEAIVRVDEQFERPTKEISGRTFTSTLAPTVFNTPDQATNVIKGTASAIFDIRLVPDTDPESVRGVIEEIVARVCEPHKAVFSCRFKKVLQGGVAHWDNQPDLTPDVMVECGLPTKVYQLASHFGLEPHIEKFWSDLASMLQAGIPAVNIGGGSIERAHKKDEYLTVSELGDLMSQMCFLAYGDEE